MSTCKANIILGKNDICKDCMKTDVCIHKANLDKDPIIEMPIEKCKYFKDRSKFIELPCKVGDTIYAVGKTKIFSKKVYEILLKKENGYIYASNCYFLFRDIGKIAFLTKEEAEQALKERNNNDT